MTAWTFPLAKYRVDHWGKLDLKFCHSPSNTNKESQILSVFKTVCLWNYSTLCCVNHVLQSSYWSSNRHEVYGSVLDKEGKVIHHLFGKWNEGIYYGDAQSAKCIWRPGVIYLNISSVIFYLHKVILLLLFFIVLKFLQFLSERRSTSLLCFILTSPRSYFWSTLLSLCQPQISIFPSWTIWTIMDTNLFCPPYCLMPSLDCHH